MDKNGEGQMICLEDLSMSRDPSFVGFTHEMFVEVCSVHVNKDSCPYKSLH